LGYDFPSGTLILILHIQLFQFIVLAMVAKPPSPSEVESEDLKPFRIFSYTIKASSFLLSCLKQWHQPKQSVVTEKEEEDVDTENEKEN